jgi:hypothetical protein
VVDCALSIKSGGEVAVREVEFRLLSDAGYHIQIGIIDLPAGEVKVASLVDSIHLPGNRIRLRSTGGRNQAIALPWYMELLSRAILKQ